MKIVPIVAHIDHTLARCDPANLTALRQLHCLRDDAEQHCINFWKSRHTRKAICVLLRD